MQATHHSDRESAPPVQDLGDTGARADDLFQVPPREALLLHAQLDRLDRVGRIHRIVLSRASIGEGREHIKLEIGCSTNVRTVPFGPRL